jgi:hypothetical protein
MLLYRPDRQFLAEGYKRYWFDRMEGVMEVFDYEERLNELSKVW